MPESKDTQRFDALLEAMVTKPPLDQGASEEADGGDLREPQED